MPIYMCRPSNNGSSGGGGMKIPSAVYNNKLLLEVDATEYSNLSFEIWAYNTQYVMVTVKNKESGSTIKTEEVSYPPYKLVDNIDISNVTTLQFDVSCSNGDGLHNITLS